MKRIYVVLAILGALTVGCCGCGTASSNEPNSTVEKDAPDTKAIAPAQAKCPVMGCNVDETIATDYKGAKLYFCCPPCIETFKAKTAKFAAKANAQLVATGQAKQTRCPISSSRIDASAKTFVVDGVTVLIGRASDLEKLKKLSDAEQSERVFADKTFAKAFIVKGVASK